MNLLKKIDDIYIGWRNDFLLTPKIKEMAERRMIICSACPHIRTKLIVRCGICGCPLSKMLKVPLRRCKDNRWEAENDG